MALVVHRKEKEEADLCGKWLVVVLTRYSLRVNY